MTELQYDWAAIDIAMLIDQATWICECRADDIEKIGTEMLNLFGQSNSTARSRC